MRRLVRKAKFELHSLRISLGQPNAPIETLPVIRSGSEVTSRTRAFDGVRAFELLRRQCEQGPRVPGTPGHEGTLAILTRELACWADEVGVQAWSQRIGAGPGAGERLPMRNVFGLIRGSADRDLPAERIRPELMLCAHWDTRPVADHDPDPTRRGEPVPGASDGASGTAVVLELARVLHARRPRCSVLVALWDGEDLGEYYYGSRLYAKVCGRPALARWRPRRAVLVDMVGGAGLRCTEELNSIAWAADLWRDVHRAASRLGLDDHFHGPARHISDDHIFLNRAGIPSVVLIDFSYPYWHTASDTVDRCCPESLQVIGDVLSRYADDLSGEGHASR